MRILRRVSFTLVAGLSLSCGGGSTAPPTRPTPPPPPPAPVATTVTVTPETASFAALGDTVRLGARALDQAGQVIANATIMWASSDGAIVTVDNAGLVTSTGNGSAQVTARTGQASGAAAITVEQVTTGIRVSSTVDTLRTVGGTQQMTATATDANDREVADAEFVWVSSDTLVVTVDAAGLVTATGNGSAEVSASWAGFSETVLVTVYDLAVAIAADRAVLVTLYNATDGSNWKDNTNWLSDRELSAWHGVATNRDGRVTTLKLSGNQLKGAIPPQIGDLDQLIELTFWENQLAGPIPPDLGRLANLKGLVLVENFLTGSIPPELGNLTELQILFLFENFLTGSMPPELGNLGKLRGLSLRDNQLEGSIPPEFGNLASLTSLDLDRNQLTGPIPPEFGRLANISSIWMSENQLEGPLPPELGDLANLETLLLNRNQLTGSIPPELGGLASLIVLALPANKLSGSIPPELGNLASLRDLSLGLNQLTGSIPPELGSLSDLTRLALGSNQLTGAVPPELGDLVKLGRLELNVNSELTGPLPASLTALTALSVLLIDRTGLCVPDETAFDTWLATIDDFNGNRCAP
ncbi:Ig-like domain-containing protein [Candidatus Palauibacter sp.]|uniref:Ig-like domain-containing protein n=1 Tax=Candidatus Palauibacter sp. TaxID=3101350 RepID=UPI003B017EBC